MAHHRLMPKLGCRCGYTHNLSPIPDDGFRVFPDWASEKILYTPSTNLEAWEVHDLYRTALSRLYLCPNCEAIMWDRTGDGDFVTYLPDERLIRIYADFDDRDPLGGIRLSHPRTLIDIERQHLLMEPMVYIVVHNDDVEMYAHLEPAIDDDGNLIWDTYVARPADHNEITWLQARGA
jgi:hypothetical protein